MSMHAIFTESELNRNNVPVYISECRLPNGKLVLVEADNRVDALGGMIHHLQELEDKQTQMSKRHGL